MYNYRRRRLNQENNNNEIFKDKKTNIDNNNNKALPNLIAKNKGSSSNIIFLLSNPTLVDCFEEP